MDLEYKLQKEILLLEKDIALRDTKEWQEETRKSDTNRYYWLFCGEESHFHGKLKGLKKAMDILKGG